MISKSEFQVMVLIKKNRDNSLSQREIANEIGCSLGKTNMVVSELTQKGLISSEDSGYKLTSSGEKTLGEFKVNNAVIMAAGMSSRFAPLSFEKPKGLLVVKGEILIEREIRQLKEAGIEDITVVVGYMKEKFFYLEDKYNVKIVVNDDYYRFNNTSTLIRVLDKLSNTYVCSSDNYFVENVFEEYVYGAYYSAVYASGQTNEYCLKCDVKGRIKSVEIGGADSWYMLGHVYFDKNFSEKFADILRKEYEKLEVKENLWENLYMKHVDELDMFIRKYDADKVLEFDSLDELRYFDSEYINNADSRILKNIASVFECEIKDIVEVIPIKAGLTNISFRFKVKDAEYVYRHPGIGTEEFINRFGEANSMAIASENGLDDTFVFMNEQEGWKISKYIKNVRELDYHNESQVDQAIKMMRKLHNLRLTVEYDFNLWSKTIEFVDKLNSSSKSRYDEFNDLLNRISQIHEKISSDGYEKKILCHNDCYSPNFLLDENDKMYLIDWEYSGNDDPASDLGTFICCSDYNDKEAIDVIVKYDPEAESNKGKLAHYTGYVALTSYYWYVWALVQELNGNNVGDWLYIWYKNSKVYAGITEKLLGE